MQDNISKLYTTLTDNGYEDLGSEDKFRNFVKDSTNVKKLYAKLQEDGFEDLGSEDKFMSFVMPSQPSKPQGMIAAATQKPEPPASIARPTTNVPTQKFTVKEQNEEKAAKFRVQQENTPFMQRQRAARQQAEAMNKPAFPDIEAPQLSRSVADDREKYKGMVTQAIGRAVKAKSETALGDAMKSTAEELARQGYDLEAVQQSGLLNEGIENVLAPSAEAAVTKGNKLIDQVFDEAKVRAAKARSEQTRYTGMGGAGSAAASRLIGEMAYNKEIDPDALQAQLTGTLDKDALRETFAEVQAQAEKYGIDPTEYFNSYVAPRLREKASKALDKFMVDQYMPKDDMEYVLSGFSDSITGMLTDWLTKSASQNAYKQMALSKYEASSGTKIARQAVGLIASAPEFAVSGGVSSAVVKKLCGSALTNIMARGYTQAQAQRILASELARRFGTRVGTRIMQSSLSGSVNFATLEGMSEGARQLRDDDFSVGNIVRKTAEGGIKGAIFGAVGGSYAGATEELHGATKVVSNLLGVPVNGAALTISSNAVNELNMMMGEPDELATEMDSDGNMHRKSLLHQWADNTMLDLMMRGTSHHNLNVITKQGRTDIGNRLRSFISPLSESQKILGANWQSKGISDEGRARLQEITGADNMLDALSYGAPKAVDMEKIVAPYQAGGVKPRSRSVDDLMREEQRQVRQQNWDRIMNDRELSAADKQKICQIMGAKYHANPTVSAELVNGVYELRDAKGLLNEKREDLTQEERNSIRSQRIVSKAMALDNAGKQSVVATAYRYAERPDAEGKVPTDEQKEERVKDFLQRFTKGELTAEEIVSVEQDLDNTTLMYQGADKIKVTSHRDGTASVEYTKNGVPVRTDHYDTQQEANNAAARDRYQQQLNSIGDWENDVEITLADGQKATLQEVYEIGNNLPEGALRQAVEGYQGKSMGEVRDELMAEGAESVSLTVSPDGVVRTTEQDRLVNDYYSWAKKQVDGIGAETEAKTEPQPQTEGLYQMGEGGAPGSTTPVYKTPEMPRGGNGLTTEAQRNESGITTGQTAPRSKSYETGMQAVETDDLSALTRVHDQYEIAVKRVEEVVPADNPARNAVDALLKEGRHDEAHALVDNTEMPKQQADALHLLIDADDTIDGVNDAIQAKTDAAMQQIEDGVKAISDEQGNVTFLTLRSGKMVHVVKGDINSPEGTIMVREIDPKTNTPIGDYEQITIYDIKSVGNTWKASDMIAADRERVQGELDAHYRRAMTLEIVEGNRILIKNGRDMEEVTVLSENADGSVTLQDADGDTDTFSREQVEQMAADAKEASYAAWVEAEKQAMQEAEQPQAETPQPEAPKTEEKAIPLDKKGKKNYVADGVRPVDAVNDIYNRGIFSTEQADAYVQTKIDAAQKEYDKVNKDIAPKDGEDPDDYAVRLQEHDAKVNAAKDVLDRWQAIKDEAKRQQAEAREAERQRKEAEHKAAEQARIELENKMKAQAQAMGTDEPVAHNQRAVTKGGLVIDEQSVGIDSGTATTLDAIGKALGVEIRIDNSLTTGEGMWSPGRGKNGLNLISIKSDTNTALSFLYGHEITHEIKNATQGNDKLWQGFVQAVRKAVGEEEFDARVKEAQERWNEKIKEYNEKQKAKGRTDFASLLDEAGTIEEVCCDFVGERIISDRDFANRLLEEVEKSGESSASIAQRIRDFIDKVLKAMREIVNPTDEQRRQIEGLEQAKKIWGDLYEFAAAKEREKRAEQAEAERQRKEEELRRKQEARKRAIEKYDKPINDARKRMGDDPDALAVMEDGNREPKTLKEAVAQMIPAHSLVLKNWTDANGRQHLGLEGETGFKHADLSRLSTFIGKRENGAVDIATLAERIYENLPEDMRQQAPDADRDIRNVIIELFSEAEKADDILHYVDNARIREAEAVYQRNKDREAYEAEREAYGQKTEATDGAPEYDASQDPFAGMDTEDKFSIPPKKNADGDTEFSYEGDPKFSIRVFHGSGADFEKFDHKFMGTGEGNQSFGWGTYVTEVEGVGRQYAEAMGNIQTYKGKTLESNPYSDNPADRALFYAEQEHGADKAIKFLKELMKEEEDADTKREYQECIDVLRDKKSWGKSERHIYEVEIPDDNGRNYIDWKAPLTEENKEDIRAGLIKDKFFRDQEQMTYDDLKNRGLDVPGFEEWLGLRADVLTTSYNGEDFYKGLSQALGGNQIASEFLRDCGFTGIKYPVNAMSGGNSEGTHNYVIFNENDAQIVNNTKFSFPKKKEDKTLMGVHNISEDKLKKALKLGGLANPSLAVIDTEKQSHTGFGNISLIPKSSLIDAKTGRNAGTYLGDAWTPTYPNVTKSVSKQGEAHIKAIAQEAAGGDETLANRFERAIHDYVNGNSGNLAFLFLKQKGLNPEVKYPRTSHSHEEYEQIEQIFGKGTAQMPSSPTDEQNKALFDMMVAQRKAELEKRAEKISDEAKRKTAVNALLDDYKKDIADENGKVYLARGDSFVNSIFRDEQRRNRGEIDWYGTDLDANNRVAKEGLSEEYNKWKENLLGDEDINEELFAGWTPDGYRRYVPNTVENASRLMNKETQTNSNNEGGIGATKSALLKKVSTLAAIRKNKGKLQDAETVSAKMQEASDELLDMIHYLADRQKVDDNRFINSDIAERRLQEALAERDPIKYLNKEYGYHLDADGEYAQQIKDFIKMVGELPAKYFETKFRRPVGLDEFAVAVVPEGTSEEVIKGLKDAGLDVRTYDGTEENRKAVTMNAVNGREDIKFSIAIERSDPFYSNAAKATEDIRQEKATGDQWLAMIKKNGGLKAEEDKWMGLSDWLKGKKSVTKAELQKFIADNAVEIEDVEYAETNENALKKSDIYKEWQELGGDEDAYNEMIERYGDDFSMAFEYGGETLMINDEGAAQYFIGDADNPINSTRLDYTTEGLENKREIALTVPTIEPYNEHDEIHFGDAGEGRAVAWIRFGETTDKDGSKVLVIDEIQSKRHQDAREKGYKAEIPDDAPEKVAYEKAQQEFEDYLTQLREKYGRDDVSYGRTAEEEAKSRELFNNEMNAKVVYGRYLEANHLGEFSSSIPDAPFQKTWHELALKRMLRYAAENGYDKIAWTTGEQQAERYGIGSVVEEITSVPYEAQSARESSGHDVDVKMKDGNSYSLFVQPDGTINSGEEMFDGKNASEVFGKDIANKIVESSEELTLSGDNLRVGGEGMKGFYDQMLPRFMDKYGKKWGVKTGEVELDLPNEADRVMHSVDVTPEMKESVMKGQPKFSMSRTPEEFKEQQKQAVEQKGIVMPRLNEKEIRIVDVPKHGFEGTGKEVLKSAEKWAKENIVGTHTAKDSEDKTFEYTIAKKSIDKYLSASSLKNSDNIGVHISVLKKLPEVISNSIEAEIHPDYTKNDKGVREADSPINNQSLIHRFYGAATIDGKTYRVKTTMKEYADKNRANNAYTYEVTKIELLEAPVRGGNETSKDPVAMTSNNSISGAKLLKDVEKEYDKGVKLLAQSENSENVQGGDSKFSIPTIQKGDTFEDVVRKGQEIKFAILNRMRQRKGESAEDFIQRQQDYLNLAVKSPQEARNRVVDEIKERLDSKSVDEMGKKALNQLLQAVRDAKEENLPNLIKRVNRTINELQDKALTRQMKKLLDTKTVKRNQRNMSVAGRTDDAVAQAFDFMKGKLVDVDITEHDSEKKRINASIAECNARIRDLERQLSEAADPTEHDRIAAEIADQKDLKDELREELDGAQKEIDKARSENVTVTTQSVNDMIADLDEKFAKSTIGEGEWTSYDAARLTACHILNKRLKLNDLMAESKNLQTEIAQLEAMRTEANKAHNRQQAKMIDRDIVAHTDMMDDILQQIVATKQEINNDLSGMVEGGKTSLMAKKEQEQVRKRSLILGFYNDIASGKFEQPSQEKAKKDAAFEGGVISNIREGLRNTVGSFEYLMQHMPKNTLGQDSWMYRYFMLSKDGVMAAQENYMKGIFETQRTMNDKMKELWGEKNYEDAIKQNEKHEQNHGVTILVDSDGMEVRMNAGEVVNTDGGLSKAQATYLYMVWKMPDGRAKLEKMGFDEQSIAEAVEFIGEKNKAWADWVQEEFLPTLREKYNERYVEMYYTSLGKVANYVPLKINQEARHQDVDVDEMMGRQTLNQKTGSLINRTHNLIPVDLTRGAYEIISEHVQNMEEWYHMARVRQDLNYILSSTAIRGAMNANERASHSRLVKAAQIATGCYKTDQGSGSKIVSGLTSGLAAANIALRNTTALKQRLSLPAFLGYSQDPRFIVQLLKNTGIEYAHMLPTFAATAATMGYAGRRAMMNAAGSEKNELFTRLALSNTMRWCIENMPSFRQRVAKGSVGNVLIDEFLSGDKNAWERFKAKLGEYGMAANGLVDATTCAIGIKSIYDYKYGQLKKQADKDLKDGLITQEEYETRLAEADRLARCEADIFYNGTQQSTHPAFLAPIQMDRDLASKMFTLYKNSPLSYVRKTLIPLQDYIKASKWSTVEKYAKQYMEADESMDYDTAIKQAELYLAKQQDYAMFRMALNGYFINWLWNWGGKGFLGWLQGEEDEEEEANKTVPMKIAEAICPILNGVPMVDFVVNTMAGQDVEPLLLYDVQQRLAKAMKGKEGEVSEGLLFDVVNNIAFRSGLGIDLNTIEQVYLGAEHLVKNGLGEDNRTKMIALMYLLNTPNSNRKQVARTIYSEFDDPDEFVEAVMLADKAVREGTESYKRFMPGFKEYDQKKVDEIIKEWLKLRATPEQKEAMKRKKANTLRELEKNYTDRETLQRDYDNETDPTIKKRMGDLLKKMQKGGSGQGIPVGDRANQLYDQLFVEKPVKDSEYLRLSTSEDVKADYNLSKQIKHYKAFWDELKKITDEDEAMKYEQQHEKEIERYATLSKIQGRINSLKGKLEKVTDAKEQQEIMQAIRDLRSGKDTDTETEEEIVTE